jgi:hypothetical protein
MGFVVLDGTTIVTSASVSDSAARLNLTFIFCPSLLYEKLHLHLWFTGWLAYTKNLPLAMGFSDVIGAGLSIFSINIGGILILIIV